MFWVKLCEHMQAEDASMYLQGIETSETCEPPAKKFSIHPCDVLNSLGTHNTDPDPNIIVEFMSEPCIKAVVQECSSNNNAQILSCDRSPVNLVHQSIADANATNNQVEKRVSSISSGEKTYFIKPSVSHQLEHSNKDNVNIQSVSHNVSENITDTPSTLVLQKSVSESCNETVTDGGTCYENAESSCYAFADSNVEQILTANEDKKEMKATVLSIHSSPNHKVPIKDGSPYSEERKQMLLSYEVFRSKESFQFSDSFDIISKMTCYVKKMHPSSDCFFENFNSTRPLEVLMSHPFIHPPAHLLNMILRTLLEEQRNKFTKCSTFGYLTRLLNVYPPNRTSHGFYYQVLFDGNRFMWEEISQIIQSSLHSSGVYDGKHSYDEGTYYFLRIFVNILTKDFETSELKDFLSVGVISKQAFAAVLFFVPENLAWKKLKSLLKFISDLVKPSLDEKQDNLLKLLMRLLHLQAETARLRYACHEARALYCQQLTNITTEIFVHCRDILNDVERTKIFLNVLSPLWLKIKVAEGLLTKVVPQIPFHCSGNPTTLRKIVREYIFPPSEQLLLAKKLLPSESDNYENSMFRSRIMKQNHKGETLIHVKCKRNKSDELKEILSVPGIDINAQDYAGWTPLHECCDCGSYECAKLLVTWFPPEEKFVTVFADHMTAVDLYASCEGITPLHEAVKSGSENIVQLLVEYGGPLLTNITNNEGKTPLDFAVNCPHLKNILESARKNTSWKKKNRFDDQSFNFDGDLSYSKRICPKLKSASDYLYYVYLLGVLLNTYLCFTKLLSLREYVHQNYPACDLKSCVKMFLTESGYTPNDSDIVNCLDNLFVLKRLPEVLKTLSDQINATEITDETEELFICLKLMLCWL